MSSQKNTAPTKQLILPLVPETLKSFALFAPGKNQLILETLSATEHPQFIYLYGNKGVGKSHLLEAYATNALQKNKRLLFLPLKALSKETTYLKDLPKLAAVLIDDLEYLPEAQEAGLCHLFNELQAAGTPLIVSSAVAPMVLNFKLADLKSRMESGLSLKIEALKDEELKTALTLHAQHLGLKLNNKIYDFLLNHLDRDLGNLIQQLKKVAEYSLLTRRPITSNMIKEVLSI